MSPRSFETAKSIVFVRTGSFRLRLFALVLALVLPTLVIAVVGNIQRQRLEKERATERATTIAKLAAARQTYYVRQSRQLLSTMTQFAILVQLQDKKASEVGLQNLKLLSPDYHDFGLIETDGSVFCHTLGSDVHDTVSKSLIAKSLKRPGFICEVFASDSERSAPTVQFSHPVRKTNGELVRVMYASLKTELLSETLKDVSLPEGGVVNVFDDKGILLARRPELESSVARSSAASEFMRKGIDQKDGAFVAVGLDGERRLYAVSTINDRTNPVLFVTVGVPYLEFFAEANQQLIVGCLAALLIVVFLLACAWWYSDRFFLRPLSAVTEAAERIACGDLAARAGLCEGKGELQLFVQRFDKMAESLQGRELELKNANEKITVQNADLERRVTERTSALERANRDLEAFSYSVSHDLRAPLRHMSGFAQMLARNPVLQSETQIVRQLGLIIDSAKKMGALIDDLLAFSKMGRQPLRMRDVDLVVMVANIVAEHQSDGHAREIEWKIEVLPQVQGDPALLRQVWANLISNAVKYTRHQPGPVVSIGCRDEGEAYSFFIQDNGAGFDMNYANKLFGVFQRLHSTDEFEGTGIGLAHVKQIVSRHGGRTWAVGKVGEGATIWFSLPKSPSASR